MAYIRTALSDGVGETYLRVLVEELSGSSYSEIIIYNASNGDYRYASQSGPRSTTQTFAGLTPGSTYNFYAMVTPTGSFARRIPESGFYSFKTNGFVEPDPSISSLYLLGTGLISADWSVSNASYIRPSNSFAVYMSGPGNSGQYFKEYLSSWERSWTTQRDGLGNPLVPNAYYTVWVFVYNNRGQSFGVSRSVQFTKPRPNQFNWTYPKTQNGMYNLSYNEWDSLLDKVNEFRAYRGLVIRDFNRSLIPGSLSYVEPTASLFNSVRNAINDCVPSVSVPSSVGSGQIITANLLNRLRDSLNSIN